MNPARQRLARSCPFVVGRGNAGLSPEPTQDNLLATCSFDRCDKILAIPRVHRGTFDRLLFWEHGSYLGPKIPTNAFRFYSRQYDRNLEKLSSFRECHRVINKRLAIEVANSEQHLRLMISEPLRNYRELATLLAQFTRPLFEIIMSP
jgi:hypothetical protein